MPFLDDDLRGAQHALVLALGIDHALRIGLRLREQRLHDEAGAEDEAAEGFRIGLEILERPRGDAAIHRGLRDRRRDAQDQARIERARDQRLRAEGMRLAAIGARHHLGRRLAGKAGDGLHGGGLHLLVDRGRADIERAAEDVGEAQDVVDLVRIVRAAGADHRVGPRGLGLFRHDLRIRIGERHDQRARRHLGEQLGLQHAAGREAEEHVGIRDDVGERARVGLLRIDRFPAVHELVAALVDDALDVGDPDVLALGAERHEEVEAGERRGAGARGDDLHVLDALAGEFQRVRHRSADDDRRAVLVVVEDRDAHAGLQPLLDLEAFRRLDVLEIDAAEGRLERRDHLDELVDVLLGDLDVEDVDAGELLEQDRLALHHGLGGERADIAEAQHGRAVGDHRHEVLAGGEVGGLGRVGGDGLAGGGDARGIGQRQVALVAEGLGRLDLKLSGARIAMVEHRTRFQILRDVVSHPRRSLL